MRRYYIAGKETSQSEYLAFLKANNIPSPSAEKPRTWPIILSPLRLMAREGDRGAGDIIARVIGPIGGDAFKKWYKVTFGKDCGCGNRQEALNARWPL